MDVKKHTDKYFTYTREVLEGAGFDPWVLIQVFFFKGPGRVYGLADAAKAIIENSGLEYVNGQIWALKDGAKYQSGEPVMYIEGPLRVIVELETIYLGIISQATTLGNGGKEVRLPDVTSRMEQIVTLVGDRPVYYFGARHWGWTRDRAISAAAFDGGAAGCSTDAGAEARNQKGLGTTNHALFVACSPYLDKKITNYRTVWGAHLFNDHINEEVPRIILVDTWNGEIDMARRSMSYLWKNRIWDWEHQPAGIRIDTCGENTGQYCHTKGVSVELARKVRLELDDHDFQDCPITLSSGFANPEKVQRFVEAEQALGVKLFDSLGVGQLFESRSATADIVMVNGTHRSKTGREYIENKKCKSIL